MSRIYKEILQSNNKKLNNPLGEGAGQLSKIFEQTLYKRRYIIGQQAHKDA